MDIMRADGGPVAGAARAFAVLAGLCCAAFAFSPMQFGVLALTISVGLIALPRRRMAAIEALAGLAFMAFMFGPAGAGGFALMQLLVAGPLAAGVRGARPVLALTVVAATAATASVCAAQFLVDLAPTRWAAFAPMAPAFLLAAPAMILRRMVAAADPRAADARRLNGLGPLLVALVVGAGTGGLHGAAVGWAAAQLALALWMLLQSRRGIVLAPLALGVLAAGFVAALATDAALAFARASPLAVVPAVVIGGAAFVLALRVHAPAAARRLAQVAPIGGGPPAGSTRMPETPRPRPSP